MGKFDVVNMTNLFMHEGLRTYKYKNSQMKPAGFVEDGRKGAIFGYRTKEHMIDGRGVVLTSKEAVLENELSFTHWTPNVYRYGSYTSNNKLFTVGHSEKNLKQINTFFIDFDKHSASERLSSNDILLASIDLGFMPTVILETDKGYQAYFVLETPVFVTANSNFKVIKVAKEISQNLRRYFATVLPSVDMYCNHFGIARMPQEDNTVFYEPRYVYSFKEFMNWSMKQSELPVRNTSKFTVLAGSKGKRQVDEPWFNLLLNKSHFYGYKGTYGRNNTIFTLALAYYSSGYSLETCEDNLLEFNERLEAPISEFELYKTTASAYSGNYQAAKRDKIMTLCHEWVSESLTEQDLFIQGFFSFKKPRHMRQRSHLYEWAQDLKVYLSEKSYEDKPYLVTSKKIIREELKIPERSLDKVLKYLKAKNEVFYKVKAGRNGGIQIATVKALMVRLIKLKKEEKESYYNAFSETFGYAGIKGQQVLEQLLEKAKPAKQLDLFELDTG